MKEQERVQESYKKNQGRSKTSDEVEERLLVGQRKRGTTLNTRFTPETRDRGSLSTLALMDADCELSPFWGE